MKKTKKKIPLGLEKFSSPFPYWNQVADIIRATSGREPTSSDILSIVKLCEENISALKGRLFILEFLRNGEREGHSYLGGSFKSYATAVKEAKYHVEARDGKYDCHIHEAYPDGSIELYRVFRRGDET